MDIIKRKVNGSVQNFKVYSQKEADDLGIDYIHWKEADNGDYGLSDDGYVGICLKRAEYTDKSKRTKVNVKLSYGTNWISKNSKINFLDNHSMGCYTMSNPTHWADKEAGKTRTKHTVDAYVNMLLSDKGIDWDILGNIYRPEQKTPAATVRRLMKQESIKVLVEEKVKDLLVQKGINREYVIDLHQEVIALAREGGKPQLILQAADVFMDLLEMKPGKKVVTDSIEMDFSSQITDAIDKEEKRVKLERKSEVDERE
tara:strand:- start:225 stop:995 length:771 start_codon:yes stop_codon:yes gene_type:complete